MLIGISGYKGSGKDTVTEIMKKYLEFNGSFITYKYAFADPIKKGLSSAFDIPLHYFYDGMMKEQTVDHIGVSPRFLMDTFGTGYAQNTLGKDVWINQMKHRYQNTHGNFHFIVSDVRFKAEENAVRDLGGVIVKVHRPDIERDHSLESESEIDMIVGDYEVYNDYVEISNSGSISDLPVYYQIAELADGFISTENEV